MDIVGKNSFLFTHGCKRVNTHNKVSFNIKCFKNFFPFSSIPFTISGDNSPHCLPHSSCDVSFENLALDQPIIP